MRIPPIQRRQRQGDHASSEGLRPEVLRYIPADQDEDWINISKEAKDVLKKMLMLNPKKRVSAKEALQDAWFTNNSEKQVLSKHIVERLSAFQVPFALLKRARANSDML